MNNNTWLKPFFIVAGLYDAIIGLAFIFMPWRLFEYFQVAPPNHIAYVRFPALMLLVFAAMFFKIASDPARNRELIPYGIGLKLSYCATAFYYYFTQGIPSMWMPWAWADLVFLAIFIYAWSILKES